MADAPPAAAPAQPMHALPAMEVARSFGADLDRGLAEAEARDRLERHGPNALSAERGGSTLRLLVAQFRSLLVLVLIVATVVSFALGEWIDGTTILAIVLLNAVLGFIQEYRAGQALAALRRMTVPSTTVLRDGKERRIPAEELVPGDVVAIEAGEAVPADMRVIDGAGLLVSEAALTGESFPVAKRPEPVAPETPLAERSSMLYSGTLVNGGHGRAIVVATGDATEFGRIAGLVRGAERERTPLEEGLDRTARWLVAGSLLAAALVFGSVLVGAGDATEAFLTAVALAVAAIPEGLPAAITIVLALGVQRMAARHAIVRRLAAVETLGTTTVICTDKTGTLTRNALSIQRVWVAGQTQAADEATAAPLAGAIRNSLTITEAGEASADPTDVALAQFARLANRAIPEAGPVVAEAPFDSDRKCSSVLRRGDDGYVLATKGAPEVVVSRCSMVQVGETTEQLDDAWADRFEAAVRDLAAEGMRPIALATRRLPASEVAEPVDLAEMERDMVLVALVGMIDALREEVPPAVRVARGAGIRTVMITGDHPLTAAAIAKAAGLDERPRVVSGTELAAMDDATFEQALPEVDVYARVTSEDKLRIVRGLKRRGDIVAMTGDGVNDAPALQEADIGVAMGRGGTEVAREAADIVLTDDNYASIVAAVEEGRRIFGNIRRFVMYLVSGNLAEILVVLVGALSGDAPLLAVQILWVNLITDGPPALALGVEPVAGGIMRAPPRNSRAGVLTRRTAPRILLSTALIATATLIAFAIGHASGGLDEARHYAFGTLVFAHVLTALTFRSGSVPLRLLGLRSNRALLYATLLALALQVLVFYAPPLQTALSTDAFGPGELATVVGLALPSLVVPELVKEIRLRQRGEPREDEA